MPVAKSLKESPLYLWISPNQVRQLARSGTPWTNMKSWADAQLWGGVLDDNNAAQDMRILAAATAYLAYKHISPKDNVVAETYRARVQEGLMYYVDDSVRDPATTIRWLPGAGRFGQLTDGPFLEGGEALATSRNLLGLVCAASMIEWEDSAPFAGQKVMFSAFCRKLLGTVPTRPWPGAWVMNGRSIASTHEDRPNNWGTMAGASRMALALYLDDRAHFERAVTVFRGWLGDIAIYNAFKYDDDKTWQKNSTGGPWYAVNPLGSKAWDNPARSFDGVLPEDQRRRGPYTGTPWPPLRVGYVHEAMQGAICQAILVHRHGGHGYTPWLWSDEAIKRIFAWSTSVPGQTFMQNETDNNATDDRWMAWVLDAVYGTTYVSSQAIPEGPIPGKMGGFSDWAVGDLADPVWP